MCDRGIPLPLPEDINKWRKPFPAASCFSAHVDRNDYWAPPLASKSRGFTGLIDPGIMLQANYNQLIAVQNHNNVCVNSINRAMENPPENLGCILDPQKNCHGCESLYFPPVRSYYNAY